MKPFPQWKVRSLCANFDGVVQRRRVLRRHRISWGRCVMDATRWMITELIQRELVPSEDLPDWKFARIKITGAIEKVSRHRDAMWQRTAELGVLAMRTRASQERIDRRGLFRFRAYFEASRLQSFACKGRIENFRHTNWDQSLRRNRKALGGPATIRNFPEWHLAFTRTSRDGMRTPASWDIRLRNT